MLKTLDPNATRTIVCSFDTTEPRATFEIVETLTYAERCRIKDLMLDEERDEFTANKKIFTKMGERNKEIIRVGLKKWKNIEGDTSSVEKVIEILSTIPTGKPEYDTALDYLADTIWRSSFVSESEEKNSKRQLSYPQLNLP